MQDYLYGQATKSLSYNDFVNKELVLFSNSDNERSLSCLVDGESLFTPQTLCEFSTRFYTTVETSDSKNRSYCQKVLRVQVMREEQLGRIAKIMGNLFFFLL